MNILSWRWVLVARDSPPKVFGRFLIRQQNRRNLPVLAIAQAIDHVEADGARSLLEPAKADVPTRVQDVAVQMKLVPLRVVNVANVEQFGWNQRKRQDIY